MSKFPAGSLRSPWIYTRERVHASVAMARRMEIFGKIMISRRRLAHAALLVAEICVTSTAWALCLWGFPDRFRSKLWENGGAQGWNSDPKQRIYYYANYEEPPEVPLIWSQRLTDSHLCVAALSLIICAIRVGLQPLGYLPRAASFVYDILLFSLWVCLLVGQTSGDYSDSVHPSPYPWYLGRSCSESWSSTRLACHAAKTNFALSILAAIIYGCRLALEAMIEIWEWQCRKKDKGLQMLVNGEPYTDDEEMDIIDEEEQARQIYETALSPVLAFFPESAR